MVIGTFLMALIAARPTELTFVRHGETQANASGKYNAQTLNTFSKLGESQVQKLAQTLQTGNRFDRILVSPSPRAMKTILPYLKATGQKATVWPLLYECCTQKRPSEAKPEPFKFGSKFTIPSEGKGYFTVIPGEDRLPAVSTYNQGLAQVEASLKEFRSKFIGGRILLVGHSGHGGQFLHALTHKWQRVENAKPISVRMP